MHHDIADNQIFLGTYHIVKKGDINDLANICW